MGKVSVRQCDECEGLDNPHIRVIRVTIVAVRRELCEECAVALMAKYDVSIEDGYARFKMMVEQRDSGKYNATLVGSPDVDEDEPDATELAADEGAAAAD